MKKYIIKNAYQEITFLDQGATIYKWLAYSDKRNIVITNENLEDYNNPDNGYFSNTIGRVTNRIYQGRFTLNGIEYQLGQNFGGNNHGHGGVEGFYRQKFNVVSHDDTHIEFKYFSKDMEEGYPGNLTLYVRYELKGNSLIVTYDATTDQDTIVNITNHAYFNLSNEDNVLNHELSATVKGVLDTDADLVPNGTVIDVKNTVYDINEMAFLKDIVLQKELLEKAQGLDHAFIFGDEKEVVLKYENRRLVINTTYPGIQMYSGNYPINQKLLGRKYAQYFGIALECQYEPNAINIPEFNSVILRKDDKYHETITYTLIED